MYLVEEFGEGLAEWPNREGRFDMSVFGRGSYLRVEGQANTTAATATKRSSASGISSFSSHLVPRNITSGCDATFSPLFR